MFDTAAVMETMQRKLPYQIIEGEKKKKSKRDSPPLTGGTGRTTNRGISDLLPERSLS